MKIYIFVSTSVFDEAARNSREFNSFSRAKAESRMFEFNFFLLSKNSFSGFMRYLSGYGTLFEQIFDFFLFFNRGGNSKKNKI